MLRLVTIPISHYCEKARWALDRAGMIYREERHIQGIHRVAARRAGGGSTVPVLVTSEGTVGESAQILAWVDERIPAERRLYPPGAADRREVQDLCRRLDDGLGPAARRLIYVHMLAVKELLLAFNNQGVPAWEDRTLRWGWPLMTRFVAHALSIEAGVEVGDEAVVWREFDHVAQLLQDGRPYLCGESFGAADLTFASLAAATIVPAVYGVRLPQPEVLPPRTAALVRSARDHPAGRYALELIARERGSRAWPSLDSEGSAG
jgi:glutathione S-transferase